MFGDLSVKVEGCYRLRFSLFEMRTYVEMVQNERQKSLIVYCSVEVVYLKSIISSPFTGIISNIDNV